MPTAEPSFVRATAGRIVSTAQRVYRFMRDDPSTTASTTTTTTTGGRGSASRSFSPPSPLTYLTSSYLLLSLALAFLLHRIHHLVPPANRPFDPRQQHGRDRVNSHIVQIGTRLPGVLFMLKVTAALALAFLEASHRPKLVVTVLDPSSWTRLALRILQASTRFCGTGELGRYLASTANGVTAAVPVRHASLLWQTFLAISTSITCETFVRSLSDDSPTLHSFNLLSFSFLLHAQAHPSNQDPDEHRELYLYLALTLVELITLQLSYLVPYLPTWRTRARTDHVEFDRPESAAPTSTRYRFPITLVFSILNQLLTLRAFYEFYLHVSGAFKPWTMPAIGEEVVMERYSAGGALIWFNKLPELGFELVVLASISLKTLAALIRGEELSRENLVGAPIPWDLSEDYAVVLIKYTTSLLKSTRLSHLSYELSPISVLPSSLASSLESLGFDLSPAAVASDSAIDSSEGGLRVRLERNGDVLLMEELERDPRSADGTGLRRRRGRTTEALTYGFGVEVKDVEIEPLATRTGSSSFEGGGAEWDGEWGTGFEGNVEFTAVVVRIAFYLVYVALVTVKRALRKGLRTVGLRSLEGRLKDTWTTRETAESSRRPVRDSAGRAEDDDDEEDDEDWNPSDIDSSDEEEEEDRDEEEQDTTVDENALALISDLNESVVEHENLNPTELAPYLLAHHLAPSSSSIITRQRYESLLPRSSTAPTREGGSATSSLAQLDDAVASHLGASKVSRMTAQERELKRQEWRDSRSNFCVVCTVEPRTVILWPCRCLVLCESCREALALRTQASSPTQGGGGVGAGDGGNLCPTCRSGVAGFSRIFIP
ncbi:uncharacterized protein JCM15063_000468 [Sporobolomyces koalae]|uniref:uncharacterized protein n=1 Tax=Sporobolomyces koalae TaxID=500713 RepID=UPI00316B194E